MFEKIFDWMLNLAKNPIFTLVIIPIILVFVIFLIVLNSVRARRTKQLAKTYDESLADAKLAYEKKEESLTLCENVVTNLKTTIEEKEKEIESLNTTISEEKEKLSDAENIHKKYVEETLDLVVSKDDEISNLKDTLKQEKIDRINERTVIVGDRKRVSAENESLKKIIEENELTIKNKENFIITLQKKIEDLGIIETENKALLSALRRTQEVPENCVLMKCACPKEYDTFCMISKSDLVRIGKRLGLGDLGEFPAEVVVSKLVTD